MTFHRAAGARVAVVLLVLLACSLILNVWQLRRPRPDVNSARHQATLIAHSWMDPSVPGGVAIFLADSITQSLATSAVVPYSINYGIGSHTSEQMLQELPAYQSLRRAATAFTSPPRVTQHGSDN
jgi:hypothetical protein